MEQGRAPEQKATIARFGIHEAAGSLAQAAVDLSRVTPMSYTEAHTLLSHAVASDAIAARGIAVTHSWIDETRWEDAVEKPSTVSCEAFMADHGMSRADFREVLREYRSETGYSAFEWGERDTLDSQFMSWFEWERLA